MSRAFSVPHSVREGTTATIGGICRSYTQMVPTGRVVPRRRNTSARFFAFITRHFQEKYVYARGRLFGGESTRERRGASEGLRGVTRNVTRFGRHNYVSRPGRISRHVDTYETHNIGGGEGGKKPRRRNERRNSRDARGNIELPLPPEEILLLA